MNTTRMGFYRMNGNIKLLGNLLIGITLRNQGEHFKFPSTQRALCNHRLSLFPGIYQPRTTVQIGLAQTQLTQRQLQMTARRQFLSPLQGTLRPRTIAGEPGHLSDHQLQFCFQVQHATFVRSDQQPLKLRQRFDRHVQLGIGQNQQVLDSRNKLQGRRRCLPSMRPAIVAQYAGQGLVGQFRSALLQPELTADLQQDAAVDGVRNLPLLHQPFSVAQSDERLGVITLIGSQLGQTEKSI